MCSILGTKSLYLGISPPPPSFAGMGVASTKYSGTSWQVVAKELVSLAQRIGAAKDGLSPFAVAAHGAGYTSYCGGKLDDTTAVVSYVTDL